MEKKYNLILRIMQVSSKFELLDPIVDLRVPPPGTRPLSRPIKPIGACTPYQERNCEASMNLEIQQLTETNRISR